MGKLLIRMAIKSVVVALVFSTGVVTTSNAEITRLSGADRYLTSDAIVKAGWPTGAETAVLASGLDANKVDALTVAPLAKAKNAPVVIVNPKDSVAVIIAKFTVLNTKTVYIANGTGVISIEVEKGLKSAGITTVRLGGASRYETALKIAKSLGASTSIVVASGGNAHLVDSLSIAPIAAAKGMPIFLSGKSLDAATSAYIKGLGAKITYVIGETDTVSDTIAKTLPGVIRLAGTTRYETNAKVVDNFKADTSLNFNNIFIASGDNANLIDALAGAPLAASKGAPIIFVHNTINSDINTLLRTIINATTKVTTLGGVYAVTPLATYTIDTIQTGVDNNTAITFPDRNLEQIIRDTIKKPNGDILKSDVEKLTSLTITTEITYKSKIINIEGIENFTNLTELLSHDVKITNLEPLQGLTNLATLDLRWGQISNIEPLKGLINLQNLYLSDNQISNIEALKGLTNLHNILLYNNQIIDLEPLKGLTKLNALILNNNKIINLEPLRGMTNLNILNLENNKIVELEPLKELTNLHFLSLYDNQITNVESLKGLTSLNLLTLDWNEIIDLTPIQFYDNDFNTNKYIYMS